MKNIYRPIADFEGYYINMSGDIVSFRMHGNIVKKGRNIKPEKAKNGYIATRLWRDKKPHRTTVHRLLALAFIPNPENKPQVNHKNGIKTDNRLENLEWCTSSENNKHASRVLGHKIGHKNVNCKLTVDDIPKIRQLLSLGVGQREIAKTFGVTKNTIFCIKKGLTWTHIKK